jgi:2-desacetyl-2-hydroxyethyl bacteriochlorophyllide A dehydrogenase
MASLKALVYLGPRRMHVEERPDPSPGSGEVVIQSRWSAICGSDLHAFREASPRRIPPLVMGHETVGEIAEVGDGVDRGRIGERVVLKPILSCGECARCREGAINHCASGRLVGRDLTGGVAELFVVPATAAVQIPDFLAADVAVLVEPLANAVHVANRDVRTGDTVLVIGSGPIGVLMVRAAFLQGAAKVLATDTATDRLGFAEAQGAVTIAGDVEAAVLEHTEDEGADLVIDAAGFEATWALGVKTAKVGGRIAQVGLGAASGSLDYFAVLGKEVTITGSYAWTEADFDRSLELITDDALDPTGWITTMSLNDGQQAFEQLVDGAGLFKVVFEPEA